MRMKILVLLILGALAGGTGVWAATESVYTTGTSPATTQTSGCCGFCIPDEPCPFCTK